MDTVPVFLNSIYAIVTSWWFTLVTVSGVVLFVAVWARDHRHRTHRTTDEHFDGFGSDDGGDD